MPAQTLVQPSHESHGETEPICKHAHTETSKHILLGYFLTQLVPLLWLRTGAFECWCGHQRQDSTRWLGRAWSRGWWGSPEAPASCQLFQSASPLLRGPTKLSHDLKITRSTHSWGYVCLFVLTQSNGVFTVTICLKKLFNLVGSGGVLITHSLKFRSLNINSPHTPIPSMSLFQLGACLRYLNNLPFSYMYEKMHSLSTIMQLCLSSEMAKEGCRSHFEKQ